MHDRRMLAAQIARTASLALSVVTHLVCDQVSSRVQPSIRPVWRLGKSGDPVARSMRRCQRVTRVPTHRDSEPGDWFARINPIYLHPILPSRGDPHPRAASPFVPRPEGPHECLSHSTLHVLRRHPPERLVCIADDPIVTDAAGPLVLLGGSLIIDTRKRDDLTC